MPRQANVSIENNFKNGLITEATGLNFPESACTETYNCVFNSDGSVNRRLGFDYEAASQTKAINRTDAAVSTYLWKNVSGDGNVTLFVKQVGGTIYFYETDETSVSAGAIASNITLSTYKASGAPAVETLECQFTSGNGFLVVTHPYCDPFRVAYTVATQTVTGTVITLKIRDLIGDESDPYVVDNRPTATLAGLDVHHKYNLYNQGWTTTNLTAWDTAFTTMPSNVDVMWSFKNASDAFDTATVPNVMSGNSPAPKGHFVLTLSNQDRDTASGLSGVTATTTSYYRPSTCSFFAGRIFYAGVNYTGFNSKIYFTQIIERNEQYGSCYQSNDPTSEDVFDLLPSDGGVISIPEAGTVFKLVSIAGGLIVFAANGVWVVGGSTGIGFSANDYTVSKLSSITTISATSFVDVGGYPAWWNAEGIYLLTSDGNNPSVQSISDGKIRTFFIAIPQVSKLKARGFFNTITGTIQWLYRSTEATTPTEDYEFDTILNYDVQTGAFFPWTITDSNITVNGIVVLEGTAGATNINTVVRGADTVIDGSGNTLISFSTTNSSVVPTFKYVVSYPSGGSYLFTFAETRNDLYVDWLQFDDSQDYLSYFITGYKIRGDAIKKWQSNLVRIYSRNLTPTQYYLQGIFDYAITGSGTGRWSSRQLVQHDDGNYDVLSALRKIRGAGKTLQIRVQSITGEPFDIIGWATFETGNQLP